MKEKKEKKTTVISKRVPAYFTNAVWAQIDELFNELYNELSSEQQQSFKKLHAEKMKIYNEVFK